MNEMPSIVELFARSCVDVRSTDDVITFTFRQCLVVGAQIGQSRTHALRWSERHLWLGVPASTRWLDQAAVLVVAAVFRCWLSRSGL